MPDKIVPPIHEIPEPSWESVYAVPSVESHEEIVPLSYAPEHMLSRSIYYERQIPGALTECYAREGVLERLLHASSLLPAHLRLVILDGWRSAEVQSFLFSECKNALAMLNPDKAADDITIMAQQYVAKPMKDTSTPAPHSTGGAIDIAIADRAGKKLFFGSPFDYPGQISNTQYFENKLEKGYELTDREEEALYNRRLLYFVMTQAGFVNFHCEWWHFEYGTQRWALATHAKHAIYTPAQFSLNPYANLKKI
ncbi:M15 family metallopeptidase [Halodesulfovibrio marinisediminis]|uniref:D-alanyl-D-alanine dipeptidase n=1 Tax=Halodesulfovibrio marinisediminis DSM 17456 TaxID=1121457 RepID=A0A1N6HI22_9BACT|nr:M15 family metallopeptidase [Halodesulfovibrio marinisediminis]SIO19339.1 D-alanyl-D-alanine dipeptidase [Halodesulfovibrio marinisediminis DSM 17456]